MTEKEFETIALAVKAAYPNANVLPDRYAMKTWYRALEDLDYKVAENAVWEHISTSVFPPSIAEIRGKCAARTAPIIEDWGQAWEEVQQAIRKYGSYREEEAVASLSSMTAIAMRRMGFLNLCRSENTVADRAHFQRMYEGMVKEEKRQTQLPEFVKTEKLHMIEQNTSPVLQIAVEEVSPEPEKTIASREYVESLMEDLRKRMCGKRG